jgi:hypothetical protein
MKKSKFETLFESIMTESLPLRHFDTMEEFSEYVIGKYGEEFGNTILKDIDWNDGSPTKTYWIQRENGYEFMEKKADTVYKYFNMD